MGRYEMRMARKVKDRKKTAVMKANAQGLISWIETRWKMKINGIQITDNVMSDS